MNDDRGLEESCQRQDFASRCTHLFTPHDPVQLVDRDSLITALLIEHEELRSYLYYLHERVRSHIEYECRNI